MFVNQHYRTYRFYQLVARVGTDMPQKHWDRAGYEQKGQQKGQQSSPDRRFSQTPPRGGRTEGVVRGRTPPPLQPAAEI